jgi:serine/threonine-protein kinase
VLEHEPPLAHTLDAAVPQALAHIAARAMEKNPEQRYRSARAFSRELRHWLDENTVSLDSDLPVVAAPRRRGLWIALAAAGVLLAGGALWSLAFRGVTADPPARSEVPGVAATPTVAPRATVVPQTSTASATSVGTEAPAVADAMASPTVPNPTAAAAAAVAPPVVPAVTAAKAPSAIRPAPKTTHAAPRIATRESTQERRAREARELKARALASVAAAAPATGVLRLAISPWGQVEVDGQAAGTSPPLTELSLPEGTHQITIRNADLPAFSASVKVVPGQPVHLKHRFGP